MLAEETTLTVIKTVKFINIQVEEVQSRSLSRSCGLDFFFFEGFISVLTLASFEKTFFPSWSEMRFSNVAGRSRVHQWTSWQRVHLTASCSKMAPGLLTHASFARRRAGLSVHLFNAARAKLSSARRPCLISRQRECGEEGLSYERHILDRGGLYVEA